MRSDLRYVNQLLQGDANDERDQIEDTCIPAATSSKAKKKRKSKVKKRPQVEFEHAAMPPRKKRKL